MTMFPTILKINESKNMKNPLKDNMFNIFDVWVKPIGNPGEEMPTTLFKKIENCKIVVGSKEGCYGIATNGTTFDHIPIKYFNENKIYSVMGNEYEILFFDPYKENKS